MRIPLGDYFDKRTNTMVRIGDKCTITLNKGTFNEQKHTGYVVRIFRIPLNSVTVITLGFPSNHYGWPTKGYRTPNIDMTVCEKHGIIKCWNFNTTYAHVEVHRQIYNDLRGRENIK